MHTHTQTNARIDFIRLTRSLARFQLRLSLFVHHTPWRWSRRNVSLSRRQSSRLSVVRSFGLSFVRLLRFVNLSVVWLVAASVARVRQSVNRADVAPTVVVSICSFSQRSTQRRSATMQCLGNGTFQLLWKRERVRNILAERTAYRVYVCISQANTNTRERSCEKTDGKTQANREVNIFSVRNKVTKNTVKQTTDRQTDGQTSGANKSK